MRIVAGIYKGRVLYEFKGQDIRPTPDTVRESVFDILQFKIAGARFLDLFCGTGAMGIEALSRGAEEVVFNDFSLSSVDLTKRNLEKCKITGVKVNKYDALTFLQGNIGTFDIIYLDPPYKSDLGIQSLQLCNRVLKDGGVVIFENEKPFDKDVNGLIKTDERKYGRVYLTFFKKAE